MALLIEATAALGVLAVTVGVVILPRSRLLPIGIERERPEFSAQASRRT
jgi:hypothetical protein